MRYSQAEKMEIIHLVEHWNLPVKKTLEEIDVLRATFYRWHLNYQEEGFPGLANKKIRSRQIWNCMPAEVKEQVVELAPVQPEKSCRHINRLFVDEMGHFLYEMNVYRILKGYDPVQNPVFRMIPAKDKFEKPAKRVNELWQTDYTQPGGHLGLVLSLHHFG